MPPEDQGEKTEAPTQHRRQEARNRGQVARSTDLTSVLIFLGAMAALMAMGGRIFLQLGAAMRTLLSFDNGPSWLAGDAITVVWDCLANIGWMLLPVLAAVFVAAVAGNLVQVGFLLTPEPLKPSLNKLDPIKGLGRMFSKRSLVRLLMSLGKVIMIAAIAYMTIHSRLGEIINAVGLSHMKLAALGGELVLSLGLRVGLLLLVLAILDYGFQRWQHEQDLKMSRQEVKEDLKRMEGDPQIRARRQRVARTLAMQRMSQEVPKATVVVTNPTHYAIALKYEEGMSAPKVVAKGADFIALRIRQIAAASGVPIVERKPLARALYRSCKVGDEIPVNLYKAVAEVLAYVYELARQKKIGRRIPVGTGRE